MAAIGQSNNNYSTIQLARYVTAVANSGTVYNYTLLNKVTDSDGNTLKQYEPEIRNTVFCGIIIVAHCIIIGTETLTNFIEEVVTGISKCFRHINKNM